MTSVMTPPRLGGTCLGAASSSSSRAGTGRAETTSPGTRVPLSWAESTRVAARATSTGLCRSVRDSGALDEEVVAAGSGWRIWLERVGDDVKHAVRVTVDDA